MGGIGKIPTDVRTEGTDGGRRHADSAVAILNFFAATYGAVAEYDYQSARAAASNDNPYADDRDDDDDDGGFGAGAY